MNNVLIIGTSSGDLNVNHIIKNKENKCEIVYETNIISKSQMGKENKVKILINENHRHLSLLKKGYHEIQVTGSFCSFNKDVGNRRISELYLKPTNIETVINENHINKIKLQGVVVTDILSKSTYSGLVVEAKIKVARVGNIKKPFDYIPLVAFGDIAKECLILNKYDEISMEGRIHSRDYLINKENKVKATAYEVVIHKFNKIIA